MRVDASWQTRVCMDLHELAWLPGQTRTKVACESMRVDRNLTRKNAQKLCWACCYKVETASRSKLVNNSHATTLMAGQTSKNSRWLACACIKIWDSSKLMRVDASWRSNASETCNSHQLASTRILVWSGLKSRTRVLNLLYDKLASYVSRDLFSPV